MPPEDELSDEVPLSDENEAAASSSDSGVHFATDGADAADLPITGEAPDEDPYAYQDYDGPTEDLTGQLADDAGADASYGYDAASETARFDRPEVEADLLSDSANSPDESDKYRLVQTDSGEDITSFADNAGSGSSDEVAYEPPAEAADDGDGYASHHPDMEPSSDEGDPVADGYTGADADEAAAPVDEGYVEATPDQAEVEEAPAAQGFTVEEEAPAAQGFTVEEEAQAPAPTQASRPPEPSREESRPGQVRKSAIDEMFARAAELKRQKGR